jgi:hypothetical protein
MLSFHIEGHSSQRAMLVMACSSPRKENKEKRREKEKRKKKRLFLFVQWFGYGWIVCSLDWVRKDCLFNWLVMETLFVQWVGYA